MAVPGPEEWVVVATDGNELHCFALNAEGGEEWQVGGKKPVYCCHVCAFSFTIFGTHAWLVIRMVGGMYVDCKHLLQAPAAAFAGTMATSLHRGPVTGIGSCVRKPLVMSCGGDNTVHVWNIKDGTVELVWWGVRFTLLPATTDGVVADGAPVPGHAPERPGCIGGVWRPSVPHAAAAPSAADGLGGQCARVPRVLLQQWGAPGGGGQRSKRALV